MNQADRAADAAASFFTALSESDWRLASDHLSVSSRALLADTWRRDLTSPRRVLSREKLASLNPDAPPEAIDYMALRTQQAKEEVEEFWRHQLPGFASRDDVITASDTKIAASFLSGVKARFGEDYDGIRWRVLGAVLDGETVAYALYELTSEPRSDGDGHVRQLHSEIRLVRLVVEKSSWRVADPWVVNHTSGVWNIVESSGP